MLRDWRKIVLWGAVVFYACWILWWVSAGYPLEGPICSGAGAKEDCTNYNVIFYSAWQIAEFASHWAALLTAGFIGRFRVHNFGKVPARNLSIFSTIDFDRNGQRRHFPIGKLRVSPAVLQPGAEMEFSSDDRWTFPDDESAARESAKMNEYFYVWGEVLYTDDFDTVGWTTFCHRYPAQMLGIAGVHGIDRKFARHHEEAGNEAG